MSDLHLTKQQERTQELLQLIDEHDCHLSPEDSCECVLWLAEINRDYPFMGNTHE